MPKPDSVLVVGTDHQMRYLIALVAKHYLDVQTVSSQSYAEALRLARELAPSVIVVDVDWGDADEVAAIRSLRSDPQTRDIPILVLYFDDLSDEIRCLGVQGHIRKPFRVDELAALVARLMQDPPDDSSPLA